MKKVVLTPTTRAPDNVEIAQPRLIAKIVNIPKLRVRQIEVEIIGVTALIIHAWAAKAVRMMLDKQLGVATSGRVKRDPLNDFTESMYYLPDKKGFGIPGGALKAAIVTSANDVSLKMTECKRAVHVCGDLIPIIAPPLPESSYSDWDKKYEKEIAWHHEHGASMRQDLVRLESGVADIRFRGEFKTWSAKALVEFNEAVLSAEQLVNLISAAGYGSGLLENRPSAPVCRSGENGRFRVKTD